MYPMSLQVAAITESISVVHKDAASEMQYHQGSTINVNYGGSHGPTHAKPAITCYETSTNGDMHFKEVYQQQSDSWDHSDQCCANQDDSKIDTQTPELIPVKRSNRTQWLTDRSSNRLTATSPLIAS